MKKIYLLYCILVTLAPMVPTACSSEKDKDAPSLDSQVPEQDAFKASENPGDGSGSGSGNPQPCFRRIPITSDKCMEYDGQTLDLVDPVEFKTLEPPSKGGYKLWFSTQIYGENTSEVRFSVGMKFTKKNQPYYSRNTRIYQYAFDSTTTAPLSSYQPGTSIVPLDSEMVGPDILPTELSYDGKNKNITVRYFDPKLEEYGIVSGVIQDLFVPEGVKEGYHRIGFEWIQRDREGVWVLYSLWNHNTKTYDKREIIHLRYDKNSQRIELSLDEEKTKFRNIGKSEFADKDCIFRVAGGHLYCFGSRWIRMLHPSSGRLIRLFKKPFFGTYRYDNLRPFAEYDPMTGLTYLVIRELNFDRTWDRQYLDQPYVYVFDARDIEVDQEGKVVRGVKPLYEDSFGWQEPDFFGHIIGVRNNKIYSVKQDRSTDRLFVEYAELAAVNQNP